MKRFVTYLTLCTLFAVPVTQAQTVAYGSTNVKISAFSVQDAVDKSTDGTIIFMSEGVFNENVFVNNKNLRFEGGWDSSHSTRTFGYTAIDGGTTGRPITFLASSSQVDYVSFVHGGGLFNAWGGGVLVQDGSWISLNSSPICSNVSLWAGGGLYVDSNAYAIVTGTSPICSNLAFATIGPGGAYGGGAFVNTDGRLDIVSEDADVYDNVVVDGNGGGIWVRPNAYLRLFQADVYGNTAYSGAVNTVVGGGGVGVEQGFVEIGDNCSIANNAADLGGGLLVSESVANLGRERQNDLTVEGNTAFSGGGLYALASRICSSGTVWHGNIASQHGGGMYAWACDLQSDTNLFVFTANTAGTDGGGLYVSSSTCSLQTVVFGEDTNSGNEAWGQGGGLMAYNSRMIIKGGIFAGNRTADPTNGHGGGLAVWGSTLMLTNGPGSFGAYENVALISNRSVFGGAIYITNSTLNTYGTFFEQNRVYTNGGAICSHNSGLNCHDSVFIGNEATNYGGAICCLDGDQVFIYDSDFRLNRANQGGGVYILEGMQLGIFGLNSPFYSPPDNWANLFHGNDAVGGGAVSSRNTPTMIQETAFLCNTGNYGTVSAGGTYSLSSLALPHLYMANCLLAENFDQSGGGIINLDLNATGTVIGCTIADNNGHPLYVGDSGVASYLAVSNSIIWGNAKPITNQSLLSIDYSNVQDGWGGVNNIDTNPVFFSNYHLQNASPCRNAGSPAGGSDYDIDGEQRSGNFDMGCDEFIDSDGDDLPDVIETGTGVWASDIDTGSDSGNPNSDSDPADDGAEWLADTNPNDSNHYFRIENIWLPAGQAAPWFTVMYGSNAYLEIDFATDCATNDWLHSLTVPPSAYTNEFALTPGDISFIRVRAHR